jgi:hypothetical protein
MPVPTMMLNGSMCFYFNEVAVAHFFPFLLGAVRRLESKKRDSQIATTCLLKFLWSFAAHCAISLASCVGNEMVLRVVPCITAEFLPPAV